MMTGSHVAQALIRDKFLVNLNNLVANPMRTGVERVCYEFCTRWPYLDNTIPFVAVGMDKIGILDPTFFESVRQLFEESDGTLKVLSAEFPDLRLDTSPGSIGLLSARNRIILEIPVAEALEHCRAVLSLEESQNLEFFSQVAATRPEKIFNLCHDFLAWTHSEFFPIDWKQADNLALSVSNRRKYTHNFFTSTTIRDEFVNRINRGDKRSYAVIPPGADGLGRIFRKSAPQSREFLVVGTLEPRKQSVRILRAFKKLHAQGFDARLCFAGRMGWLDAADKTELEAALKTHSWLRWVDGPSDNELRDLMMSCRATIYLSVAEGFGSPPVESLALGIPCIVSSNLPSVLDMAAGGQVRVDPDDSEGLIDAVRRLLDDDTITILQREIEALALPTWQAFVAGIASLVEEKAPPRRGAAPTPSYSATLDILTTLSLMRELDRSELVEGLVRAANPDATEKELTRWQIAAERSGWSNTEVVLNLMNAMPADTIPAGIVSEALALRLGTVRPPAEFVKKWQSRFRRLMRIPSFPAFYSAIYSDLLGRDPGPLELETHTPRDECEEIRVAYLRAAINSPEYSNRLISEIRSRCQKDYLDTVSLTTIAWKNQVLDQLANEAAVDRALLIDEDDEFIRIASLDLTGQLPSRDARITLEGLLRVRHGRERILLRLLLSAACQRRVQDPLAHLELIHRLAMRAGLARPRRADPHAIAAKVNTILALPERRIEADGFAAFFGRDATANEQSLVDSGDRHALAARLLLYGTLRGDLSMSPLFVSWAAETIARDPARSAGRKSRTVDAGISADILFETFFNRMPESMESALLTDAAAHGTTDTMIADAVRLAAIRQDVVAELPFQIAHFALGHERMIPDFDRIEKLAEKLLAAAPARTTPPWRKPLPDLRLAPAAGHGGQLVLHPQSGGDQWGGEIVTVDQLMATDGDDFVRAAYRKLLLREADSAGLTHYMNVLGKGASKAAVIYGLKASPEGTAIETNLVGLEQLLLRQRKMRRWVVRRFMRLAGIPL